MNLRKAIRVRPLVIGLVGSYPRIVHLPCFAIDLPDSLPVINWLWFWELKLTTDNEALGSIAIGGRDGILNRLQSIHLIALAEIDVSSTSHDARVME